MYRSLRGTKDIFFDEVEAFDFIELQTAKISKKFGFSKVITPIIEFVQTFKGHLGESNDIVNKEMYTLFDKNGELLALRPEGTASVVRMILSNGLIQKLPLKFFYFGPMFRYERPQKGRQRQFYQFGVEHFLSTTPVSDALMLLMGQNILEALGINNYALELNTLGTQEEQHNYAIELKKYLSKYENELSEDSKNRLKINPLRILDSKNTKDKKILQEAPKILDTLGSKSQEYFQNILYYLETMKIKYKLNNNLVRGLDYYTGLVFEFTSDDLGSQSAIIAGGRYDNLVKNMGGINVPSLGFAAGVERLSLLLNTFKTKNDNKIAIVSLSECINKKLVFLLKELLNEDNLIIELIEEGNNLTKKLKKANKIGAKFVIIVGEEEIKNNEVVIKNLLNGIQKTISFNNILAIKNFLNSE